MGLVEGFAVQFLKVPYMTFFRDHYHLKPCTSTSSGESSATVHRQSIQSSEAVCISCVVNLEAMTNQRHAGSFHSAQLEPYVATPYCAQSAHNFQRVCGSDVCARLKRKNWWLDSRAHDTNESFGIKSVPAFRAHFNKQKDWFQLSGSIMQTFGLLRDMPLSVVLLTRKYCCLMFKIKFSSSIPPRCRGNIVTIFTFQ